MSYKVVVVGDRETRLAFKRLGLKARDLSDAFGRIAADAASDARMLAPKVSGRLAADVRPSKAKTKAVVMVGRVSVPYAGVQEFGWPRRNIAAQPFMRPAADSKAESAAEEINREMKKQIRSVGLG